MEKLNMQTTNVVDKNIKRIGELFPNCLTERLNDEGKPEVAIDFDQLRQELSKDIVEGSEERYQFTWPDKRNAIRLANAPTTDTLRPCREESVDFDNTQNLYIEGDNLEVLKLLRENYLGKVKMIYIDPPYNTGNDFVYNDDFAQSAGDYIHNSGQEDEEGNRLVANTESNGRFHTDWLNMIYPRLKVAKDLLSEDGVIFISIDDNEEDNLRKLCNEIFGQSNTVGVFVWTKKKKGSHLSKTFRSMTEYVLCYAKNITNIELFGEDAYSDKWQPIVKKTNAIKVLKFPANLIETSLSSNLYSAGIYAQDTTPIEFLDDFIIKGGQIVNTIRVSGPFVWTQAKLEEEIKAGTKFSLSNKYGFNVFRSDQLDKVKRPSSIIDAKVNVGTNEDASTEIEKLFGRERIMDYPKPSSLIRYLINTLAHYDAELIALDFFSGSATTAHAVMQLNAEDGGKRKFIMVQLPEATDEKSEAYKAGYKNICEIGKERIRRAGKKIKEESTLTTQDLDTGFRDLKLDSSNMNDVYYTPAEFNERDLFEDNIKPDRTDEDLLFQVMIKLGIELSAKIEKKQIAGKTVWKVSDGYLLACFDENVNETTITEIAKQHPYYFVMRDKSLANDNVADNFEQIFEHYSKDTIRRII